MNTAGRIVMILLTAFVVTTANAAVGYVNTTLTPGWNLISNPLNTPPPFGPIIGSLFQNVQGGVPDGLSIFKLKDGAYIAAQYQASSGKFLPESAAAEETVPGDGVFVYLPGTEQRVITFVGEIPQGLTSTPIPRGISIKSSVVPQRVRPDSLGQWSIPASGGDALQVYDPATRTFLSYRYDDLENQWSPPLPLINVGQAFIYFRAGEPTNWVRQFSVNNPLDL